MLPGGLESHTCGLSLTHPAESRYAPVEGGALAVADALDKARHFVLGCSIVAVDHKPLLKLFGDRSLKTSQDEHWQCFWNSQYPIPSLLQSVARQVGQSFSKICTPSLMRLQISVFEASNDCCKSLVHLNVADGFSSALNGDIMDAIEKAYVDQAEPGTDIRDAL